MTWEAVAAMAGVAAAGAAAWQLWKLRSDALDSRAAEIASVAVVTVVKRRPWENEIRDGRANWSFDYTVINPGRLPISDVRVTIDYPCPVQRPAGHTLDKATRQLSFPVPVVAARSSYEPKTRWVSVAREYWDDLDQARITVSFWTPDAGRCTTTWPSSTRVEPGRALRRRLAGVLVRGAGDGSAG